MTAFSGKNAYRHLQVLTAEIGPRHGGSAAEAEAAKYIHAEFKKYGLKSRIEKYPIYSFDDAVAELTLPGGKTLPCVAVPLSGNTPPRGTNAPALLLEDAHESHLTADITGKIIVMFDTFRGDEQRRFHALKPKGLVSIQTSGNKKPLRSIAKVADRRKFGSLPTVRITLDDGLKLIKRMPERLTLKVKTINERITKGCNVIAELPGSRRSDDDVIVICAHYDSVWRGPGAVDNGGGTANMLELARIYAAKGSEHNLRFIAFGGEEMGLWGANAYIKKMVDEERKLKSDKDFERDGLRTQLDRIRLLVNLDMMGPLHGRSTAITLGHSDIAASARLLASEMGYTLNVRENTIYSSDNMAFNYAGTPSISWNRYGYKNCEGHTENDTIKSCSPEGLQHIGAFIQSWIDRYLMHPAIPFPRTLPQEAKQAVNEWFKGRNPLDYEVFGPQKRFREKNTPAAKRR